MKYEIDIDLGPLADEWEPVAFRKPTKDERFVSWNGDISCTGMECTHERLIVRRRWQWPEWLTAEWIAMDFDGSWWCYSIEPQLDEKFPKAWSGSLMKRMFLLPELVKFTPPPCTEWRQSKRRNPNAKATT